MLNQCLQILNQWIVGVGGCGDVDGVDGVVVINQLFQYLSTKQW